MSNPLIYTLRTCTRCGLDALAERTSHSDPPATAAQLADPDLPPGDHCGECSAWVCARCINYDYTRFAANMLHSEKALLAENPLRICEGCLPERWVCTTTGSYANGRALVATTPNGELQIFDSHQAMLDFSQRFHIEDDFPFLNVDGQQVHQLTTGEFAQNWFDSNGCNWSRVARDQRPLGEMMRDHGARSMWCFTQEPTRRD